MLKQLLAGSTLMGLLLFGGASTVNAQQAPAPQPGGMQETPQMDVSESDLERFAIAIQQIQPLNDRPRLK